MGSPELEVARWYTQARRFPKLIGRFQDGRAIPGGPYTQTQFVVGVAMLLVASKTGFVWAHFGLIGNTAVLVGGIWGTVWGLGRLPLGSRSPAAVGAGIYSLASAPTAGKIAGRKITLRRPHLVRARVSVSTADYSGALDVEPIRVVSAEFVDVDPTDPERPTPRPVAVSNVQRLLAAGGSTS